MSVKGAGLFKRKGYSPMDSFFKLKCSAENSKCDLETQWLRASKNKTALDSGMLRGVSIHSLPVVLGIARGLCLRGL